MKNPIFSKTNSPTEKIQETNSHYFLKIYNFSIEHFYVGPIIWPKFAKIHPKNMHGTPESSTYWALQAKPWVEWGNLIYHIVSYNALIKLSVHHHCVGVNIFWATRVASLLENPGISWNPGKSWKELLFSCKSWKIGVCYNLRNDEILENPGK